MTLIDAAARLSKFALNRWRFGCVQLKPYKQSNVVERSLARYNCRTYTVHTLKTAEQIQTFRYLEPFSTLFRRLISANIEALPPSISFVNRPRPMLFASRLAYTSIPNRTVATWTLKHFAKFARLRNLLLAGTAGGSIYAYRRYEDFHNSLPDIAWMKELLPTPESLQNLSNDVREMNYFFRGRVEDRLRTWRQRWTSRMSTVNTKDVANHWLDGLPAADVAPAANDAPAVASTSRQLTLNVKTASASAQEQQDEMLRIQLRYQKEIERLERETKELRKQLLLLKDHNRSAQGPKRRLKRSLIEMYSEVLDELASYDSSYNVSDHLPRVVVVGDQSSGKTSVLEMVAQARIFPRGSGEMMTRAPVKVTLSEGPYHVAGFRDSDREFDLTKESDLQQLRHEVELRMKNSVREGDTVSNEVISMYVKGPGLRRMVLVDLPGIISTVTQGMRNDTRATIRQMCRQHMSNPNAIILCIQDGSLDAERSNVTDLVTEVDPSGKRTIFVLTKVDLAESSLYNPDRIKQILAGKLFPMKALGYFAVVTGKGNEQGSIDDIRQYEEEFFQRSKLFKDGVLKPHQMTTPNLSYAVSDCFWKMVKQSVAQQVDTFKACRFNLETEWKNLFPQYREMSRDELFEKIRADMLDQVVNLSQISAVDWEHLFSNRLWRVFGKQFLEEIYIPVVAATGGNVGDRSGAGAFNTLSEIKLREWAENSLPRETVQIGWQTLVDRFRQLFPPPPAPPGATIATAAASSASSPTSHHVAPSLNYPPPLAHASANSRSLSSDPLFATIEQTVLDDATKLHIWDAKAGDTLRLIQKNALQDKGITDKKEWLQSISFMQELLKCELEAVKSQETNLAGPSRWRQWTRWEQRTAAHRNWSEVRSELLKLLLPTGDAASSVTHDRELSWRRPAAMTAEEVTVVRKNLEHRGVKVDQDVIRDTWQLVFREHFLSQAFNMAEQCKRLFHHHRLNLQLADADERESMHCQDVVLFFRLQKMLQVTSKALRQQVMNNEAQRLERNIKDLLDDLGEDKVRLKQLMSGKRVQLAEELRQVRRIQEMLEDFMHQLQADKDK